MLTVIGLVIVGSVFAGGIKIVHSFLKEDGR